MSVNNGGLKGIKLINPIIIGPQFTSSGSSPSVNLTSLGIQRGSTTATTDGSGQITITFPTAFSSTPTAVTATVNGSDYFVRIVSKSASQVILKILNQNSTATSSTTVVTGISTTSVSVITESSHGTLYAASSSGGSPTSSFDAPQGISNANAITLVVPSTSTAITGLPTSFSAVTTTSVTVDWVAIA